MSYDPHITEIIESAKRKPVSLIAGPTASGKSALAIAVAQATGAEVVNADALQVYDRWRILTARPTEAEMAGIPHHLFGHVGRQEPYSVGRWLREVGALLAGRQRLVITGGTGLYFTALTEGLAEIPDVAPAVREAGNALTLDELRAGLDAETAARLDLRNRARVQRAWEVVTATGRGLAAWQAETPPPLLPLEDTFALVIAPERDWLAERIDRRFDRMMAEGALDEARAALPHWDGAHPSARAIGAPELIGHLNGEATLDEAVTAAKSATRDYARRQRKWFRGRMADWNRLALP